jgi:hypothetical protein
MKIKLDENLPFSLATSLTRLGHDVHTVYEEGLMGHPDHKIWGNGAEGIKVLYYPGPRLFRFEAARSWIAPGHSSDPSTLTEPRKPGSTRLGTLSYRKRC